MRSSLLPGVLGNNLSCDEVHPVIAHMLRQLPGSERISHQIREIAKAKAGREWCGTGHLNKACAHRFEQRNVGEYEEHLVDRLVRKGVLLGETSLFKEVCMSLNLAKVSLRVVPVGNLRSVERLLPRIKRTGDNDVGVRYEMVVLINIHPCLGPEGGTRLTAIVRTRFIKVPLESCEIELFIRLDRLCECDLKIDSVLSMPIVTVVNGRHRAQASVRVVIGHISKDRRPCAGQMVYPFEATFTRCEGVGDRLDQWFIALLPKASC